MPGVSNSPSTGVHRVHVHSFPWDQLLFWSLSGIFPSAQEPLRPLEVEQCARPPFPPRYGVLGALHLRGATGVFCLISELFLPLWAKGSWEPLASVGPSAVTQLDFGTPLTGSVRPHIPKCQDMQVCLARCPEDGEPGTHHERGLLRRASLVIPSHFLGGQPRWAPAGRKNLVWVHWGGPSIWVQPAACQGSSRTITNQPCVCPVRNRRKTGFRGGKMETGLERQRSTFRQWEVERHTHGAYNAAGSHWKKGPVPTTRSSSK